MGVYLYSGGNLWVSVLVSKITFVKESGMKFLDTLAIDISSEYEMLGFLKTEVKKQTEEIHRLEQKLQMAYTYGYEDAHRGLNFDHNFKIDDSEDGP